MSLIVLTFAQFLTSIAARKVYPHCVLLGAGASKNSGIQTATECIEDWKRAIYISNNLEKINSQTLKNLKPEEIQKWLDDQGSYPPKNHNDEYSFYAENALPNEDSRKAYFEGLFKGKTPSSGYLILCQLIKQRDRKSVV